MDLGDRLKELRKEAGLTQKELADKVGLHFTTISDYERKDKNDPLKSTLISLALIFNVSMDYLTGDSDIKDDLTIERIKEVFLTLNEENKLKLISFAEFLRSEQK